MPKKPVYADEKAIHAQKYALYRLGSSVGGVGGEAAECTHLTQEPYLLVQSPCIRPKEEYIPMKRTYTHTHAEC